MGDVLEAGSDIRQFAFETDAGVAGRATIGLIVLATDQTIEYEFRKIIALPGVALYQSRIKSPIEITPDSLRAMESEIAGGTDVILPSIPLDVVGFGCTSASMLLGEETVGKRIREARPDVPFTTPITGAFAGLRALGAKRIAVLTPYTDAVNVGVRDYVQNQGGFEVTAMGSFKEIDDRVAARISPASIAKAAEALVASADVDALFISCTSLRIIDDIAELEARIGVPATSSNHALAWHSLRLAGVHDKLPQFGKLFTVSP